MTRPRPDRTIDTSGAYCPVPMLETNRAIKTMQAGEVLEVISTDLGSKMDIPAWCGRTGNRLLYSESDGKTFRFYVRKRN
jgi:tRNA 2-thiouridine synthesizing protein A